MKWKRYLIITVILLLTLSLLNVLAESGQEAVVIPDEEWSWSRGSYNTFTGRIDLSGCDADELTVSVSTDLPYNHDTEQQSMPVFTSVNGKRIVMTKQSDTVHISRENADGLMAFSGSFRLPEKKNVEKISFVFSIKDQNGLEIKTVNCRVEASDEAKGNIIHPFYIPININLVTIILTISAIMIWAAVFIKNHNAKKTHETGE